MVYLLVGQDIPAKEELLAKIKTEHLTQETADFNQDTLYARDTALNRLKEAQNLKEESKAFLRDFVKKPAPGVVLVLDMERGAMRDEFISAIAPYAKVCAFKEEPHIDTFTLGRTIEARKIDTALRLLHQLLDKGEKPERILGGLRHSWEQNVINLPEAKRRLKLLLNCDVDIKTGRLKPELAMEKLVISLCAFTKL
jgi:DNA polymerase III delta subunit